MATVRITDELLKDVCKQVARMKVTAREFDLKNKGLAIYAEELDNAALRDFAEHVLWGSNHPLLGMMPAAWVTTQSNVIIIFKRYSKLELYCTNVRVPPRTDIYSLRIRVGEMVPIPPEVITLIEGKQEYNTAISENGTKFRGIENQVQAFLNSQPSLNTALKLQPALKSYIPDSYLQRMEVVTERQKRSKEEKDAAPAVDIELLASVGVTHEFIKGGT